MLKSILIILAVITLATGFYIENRVVNGTDAGEGEFPYMVSLRKTSTSSHRCGGSILDETHILTAAHCVYGVMEPLDIQYGVLRIDQSSNNVISVLNFTIHQNYSENIELGIPNDVAVLTLASPLNFTELVQPMKLPAQNTQTSAGEIGTLTGWGLNSTDNGTVQEVLQKVNLSIYSDDDCESIHGVTNRQWHICAGVQGGGQGQCSGDSGGPIVVNGTQRGIVSWSIKPCTIAPYPGVYTKVASYVDWICAQANCRFG